MSSFLFSQGFQQYLENGKYSDLTLRTTKTEGNNEAYEDYKVHRLVLSHSSEFFARLLMGDFKESTQTIIELKYPDPHNVFPTILKYMYGGNVPNTITTKNVVPVLAMADHYLIHDLERLCRQYIFKNVNKDNALEILRSAITFQLGEIIEHCCNILSKNFFSLVNPDFTSLPYDVFNNILHHKYLAVMDEFDLCTIICSYVQSAEDQLTTDQINSLMECIRFRWMTFNQLQTCRSNPLIPNYLLLEAIMARLRKHELSSTSNNNTSVSLHSSSTTIQNNNHITSAATSKSTSTTESSTILRWTNADSNISFDENTNRRLRQRISCLTFEHRHDFDDRGIIHYIMHMGNKWHKSGDIQVTASSIEMGKANDLLNRTPSELWTKDIPASWFTVDLGPNRSISPTHYTLRHGGNYKADSLRTWDLQGSKDGKQWVVLRRHTHDTSLIDKFATHTWSIEGNINEDDEDNELVETPTNAYRFFRILQTGRNSSNHNFLVLSGIELYGDLFEWNTIQQ